MTFLQDDVLVNDPNAYRLPSSPPSRGSDAILDDEVPSEDMGPSSPTISHGKRKNVKEKRVRITKKNPLYGIVQGAMRGSKAIGMFCRC